MSPIARDGNSDETISPKPFLDFGKMRDRARTDNPVAPTAS
jgi:hypothetical protein